MNRQILPSAIASLVEYLDNLTERATIEELRAHLSQLDVSIEDLRDFVHFGTATYRRNLVCEGEHYELLCICWRSGQRSPVHNHASSTCGLRILQGTVTETTFDATPCGQVKAGGSKDLHVGLVTASQDEQTHQISNLQTAGDDLVTLHIYSPPLRRMDTFSILGDKIGEFCPEVFEVSFGAGI